MRSVESYGCYWNMDFSSRVPAKSQIFSCNSLCNKMVRKKPSELKCCWYLSSFPAPHCLKIKGLITLEAQRFCACGVQDELSHSYLSRGTHTELPPADKRQGRRCARVSAVWTMKSDNSTLIKVLHFHVWGLGGGRGGGLRGEIKSSLKNNLFVVVPQELWLWFG